MNIKEWRILSRLKENKPKGIYIFYHKAKKYFNLQKGEVIHHLRETKEQQEFNDQYYERWGFDFDGQMKYCIKWTREEHSKYHMNTNEHKEKLRKYNKTRIFTEETRKKMSLSATRSRTGMKHSDTTKKNMSLASSGKQKSEQHKQNMRKPKPETFRIKNGEYKKNCRWFNNGIINKFCKECPLNFWPGRLKVNIPI